MTNAEKQERKERMETRVKSLQEMRNMMLESENWENMKDLIEAVTYGGMAIQRILKDEEAVLKALEDVATYVHNYVILSEAEEEKLLGFIDRKIAEVKRE